MATHGTVGEFDSGRETWVSYSERLEQYFIANDVAGEEKKRAILLSVCGASIRNLSAPEKPTTKTFVQLVKLVQDHHQPAPSVTVRRFAFHSRIRKKGESFADFIAHLRQISEHCEFGNTLNDMLCGCNSDHLQRQLLAKSPTPSFEDTVTFVQAFESAQQNVKDLQTPVTASVNALKSKSTPQAPKQQQHSYRCGGMHSPSDCRFKVTVCSYCKKMGHIARACRSKGRQQQHGKPNKRRWNNYYQQTHQVTEGTIESSTITDHKNHLTDEEYKLFSVEDDRTEPIIARMTINGADLEMEVDTGASASIISSSTYQRMGPNRPALQPSSIKLRTYTGEKLSVLGSIDVTVKYEAQQCQLQLLVVKGSGPSLLGRDWLLKIKLNWNNLTVNHIHSVNLQLNDILTRHSKIFKDELGLVRSTTAKIHVDPQSQPRFHRTRSIPYALREKVEQELERLEKASIIETVEFSDWAAPIVPVVKRDGTVRICGDYKLTVNQAAKLDSYPLPKIEDLFTQLAGGKKFTKLDLAHAYQQIELDPDSKQYLTINTHKGLYQYNRLPFGVHSAPAIFQRTMEGILRGIPYVSVYIDDILITGKTNEEHLKTLDTVLTKLEDEGMRLKRNKCAFLLPKVEYLGHTITAEGLHPDDTKVHAISEAPPPHNVGQLRSFLGMVNYYGKFLHHLSSLLAPLYKLLQKEVKWYWGPEQKEAFSSVKQQLTSSRLLVHYDSQKDLLLSCDASPYGVGAVLSHIMDDHTEKPIAFASRSLAPAEKKYSQLDKEGLAIVFGVKKFHQYLFGRKFIICSDHKPLQHIFSETRPIPAMASARIQRWALTLSAYDYSIVYRPGEKHANADLLSRLPLPDTISDVPLPGETVLLMEKLQTSPITAQQIKIWTDRDPLLGRVRNFVLKGWKETNEDALRTFVQKKDELSVQDGCLLWGCRVVIPTVGREKVLDELHEGHPGVVKMKSLARSMVWWPGIDIDLQEKVRKCKQCQINQKSPALAPLHPWDWPKRPWARIHIDHAGPFQGKIFLVVVDAHSKWLEVVTVPTTSSQATIKVLRTIFATHGLPELIVSDNGTSFTSWEFQQFTKRNGIRHVTTAPYHPASNGLAERAVQILKEGLRKMVDGDIDTRLARILYRYRMMPHSTTGVSPAELLMGRKLRSHLDLLQPDISSQVLIKQAAQKAGFDKTSKERTFKIEDPVYVRNFSHGNKWLSGIITKMHGLRTIEVRLSDGRIVRRHLDHIRYRTNDQLDEIQDDLSLDPLPIPTNDTNQGTLPPTMELRRSSRVRYPPDRYTPNVN